MVYGEWVLILNFLVDGVLLRITGRLWGYPAPWGRWALASALGAAGALLALCGPPWMGGWAMKAALPALMALICWPLASRRFFSLAGTLLGVALLAGGGALALMLQLRAAHMPGWAASLSGLMITLLLSAWTLVPRQLRAYRRTVCCRAAGCRFYARVDTGNGLTEPVSGCPVILLSPDTACRVFGQRAALLKASEPAPGVRLIPCRTLHGGGLVAALPLSDFALCLGGRWRRCPPVYAAVDSGLNDEGVEGIIPPLSPLEGGVFHEGMAAQAICAMDEMAERAEAAGPTGLYRRKRYAAPPASTGSGAGGSGGHVPGGTRRPGTC